MGTGFEFRILGPLEVLADGVPVEIAARQRVLLASLLLDANRTLSMDALITRLWDDAAPPGARNTVQNLVLRLRKALGPDNPVRTRPEGYLIEVGDDELDLRRFTDAVDGAKEALAAGDTDGAAAGLRAALALWRGDPLTDVPSEQLHRDQVPALTELRLAALELRIDTDLELGRHADVLPELRELTATHPLRERFWAQRVLALYRAGRQADALAAYREVSRLLADGLGIDPGAELRELHQRILAADPGLTTRAEPVDRRHGNLPSELTTFVGRQRELARARQLLDDGRLVTLTGPGGVGKTTLALRVARQLAGTTPDGVRLVDLSTVDEPGPLTRTVAEALGTCDRSGDVDLLIEHLTGRRLLLVLDNCEHVLPPVTALVLRLLRATPGLRVLATSRQRLGLPGEQVLRVPPLPEDEAVRLLSLRGAAATGDFQLTERSRDTAARLCQALDGIPLAIELAAVQLTALSLDDILGRLDDRFHLLTGYDLPAGPSHHRTLRHVVDWSHELCSPSEQLLWARLSVLAGFDLAAAERICADAELPAGAVTAHLVNLVNKSIVVADTRDGPARYRMLETIREYGTQRLAEQGRAAEFRRRHREYFHRMAATAVSENLGSSREVEWQARLERELPNLRLAMEIGEDEPPAQALAALEIATNITRCCFYSGNMNEGRHWLAHALACGPVLPPRPRAEALALQAYLATMQGDQDEAEALLAQATELAGAEAGATLLFGQGVYALCAHADPASLGLLTRAREGFTANDAPGDAHMALIFETIAAVFLGDRDTAERATAVCLAEAEARQAAWARSWGRWCVGLSHIWHGNPADAEPLLRKGLVEQRDIGDRWGPAWGLSALAWAAAATGRPERAARLLGAAQRLRERAGVRLIGLFREAHVTTERQLSGALGRDAYLAAFREGLDAEDGISLAL
ncbi:BTAD domain-containing putative transcriptional regulator [Amycolatopsis suaedae]|uniref:Helix-turn-helix domain-containing protein n=1 Tax=Amycolatopsis suaedae TaxID=2510978 RepID=A0A4Q7J0F5_9PSEU|nr:BTAD domain-containing putative transcriptional regulator [Amycolatopsis suaedae]RZQ60821.1 helix-turn-helix domain-containing protein [Amycolatopsis suaedae]